MQPVMSTSAMRLIGACCSSEIVVLHGAMDGTDIYLRNLHVEICLVPARPLMLRITETQLVRSLCGDLNRHELQSLPDSIAVLLRFFLVIIVLEIEIRLDALWVAVLYTRRFSRFAVQKTNTLLLVNIETGAIIFLVTQFLAP